MTKDKEKLEAAIERLEGLGTDGFVYKETAQDVQTIIEAAKETAALMAYQLEPADGEEADNLVIYGRPEAIKNVSEKFLENNRVKDHNRHLQISLDAVFRTEEHDAPDLRKVEEVAANLSGICSVLEATGYKTLALSIQSNISILENIAGEKK